VRIAIVAACPFPSPQGSQVFVSQMSEQLARRGHEVHLFTYGQGQAVEDRGFRHHRTRRLPADDASRSGPRPIKPMLDGLLARLLIRVLASAPFDVVHCHNYEAALVGLAARLRCGVPVVYHSHNLMGDELPTYFSGRARRLAAGAFGRFLDSTVPRSANHVIALCRFSAAVLGSKGVRAERMSVIAPAVEDEGAARPAASARAELGLGIDGPVVGYCGNLDAYQSLDLLLDAVALIGRDRGVRLLIATHARDARFEAALAARSLTRCTVFVDARVWAQARTAMEAADVLVLPRRHGSGWPIKLLNYLSLGRPVVAAGCGAKFLYHGRDALLAPDGDPAALASAIRALLDDARLARRLATAARSRFLREFTWDAVLPAVEHVHERCRFAKPLPRSRAQVNVEGWEP
jgi:glycosyltransferase involved in cell wall biosynthesis